MTDAAFWDGIAEKYSKQKIGNEEAYAATLARVRHWVSPDAELLELGCGTGTTALKLADAAARITGTDVSGEMVRIARAKAEAAGAGHVSFEVASAEEAGAGRRFDVVTAFNLLHLVADRGAVLRNVRERLPDGGLFVSKTPCLGGKPWFRLMIAPMRWVGKAPSNVGFVKPAGLEAEIRAAGFEIVETGGYPKSLPNHFVVARAV